MPRRARSSSSSGQSLVEFAIVVPVILTVLLMAVDFGRVYLGWVDLTNVARIGANFAADNPDAWQGSGDSAVQLRYRQLMARDAQNIDCTLPSPLPEPTFIDSSSAVGSRVQVNLTCSFSLLTPLISALVGDGAGHVNVASNAVFTIRFGSPDAATIGGNHSTPIPTGTATSTSAPTATPGPTAGPTATPSPAPTGSSGPTPTPGASATPSPGPTATATASTTVVSFYGTPTSTDSSGGGSAGSQIVGIPSLAVTFYNTTTGTQGNCNWVFGDGGTVNACSGSVSHTYTSRGTYTVSLTVDGQTVTRSSYVLSSCKVPAFAGVRKNSAVTTWTNAGFVGSKLSTLSGTGNYKIGFQSIVGGLVNPTGGCSGATISVGP